MPLWRRTVQGQNELSIIANYREAYPFWIRASMLIPRRNFPQIMSHLTRDRVELSLRV